jgi:diguanylate cyclase (GGDEF)-like protein
MERAAGGSVGRHPATAAGAWGKALARGVLVATLAWSAVVGAATPGVATTPIADFFRETWTTRDGLPHNSVNAITQTPDGYVWFATWEGVVRYNGRDFTAFDRAAIPGLPDSGLRALHLAADGSLFAGGSRGAIARYREGRWLAQAGGPGLVTELLLDRQERLWVGTESDGLLVVEPDGTRIRHTRESGLPGESAYSLAEDPLGRVWIGTDGGLVLAGDGAWRVLGAEAGLPAAPVLSVTVSRRGRLLVGTEAGAFVADARDAEPRFSPLHPALVGVAVSRLLGGIDGTVWVGTVNRGLMRVDAGGLQQLGTGPNLPTSRVLSLFLDREGNLWVGTNGGLFRFTEAPFTSLTRERGLSDDYVRTVLAGADGALWVGTAQGLNRVGDGGVEQVGRGTALEELSVLSLAEARDGGLWVGSYGDGALLWRDGAVARRVGREDGLPSNEVRAVLDAGDGTWFGTTHGLAHLGPEGMRVYRVADGLPGDYVISLARDEDGVLWVGTGVGVARMIDGALVPLDLAPVDGAEYALGFYEDRALDAMWIATDRGLARYSRRDGRMGAIGRDAGLPFDKLFSIVADHSGALWLSGNRGVLRLDRLQAEEVMAGQRERLEVERFTEADGMASAQCNGGSSPAAAVRADGSVWFATAVGVATVQPERLLRFAQVVPPVVVEQVLVDGAEQPLGDAPVVVPDGAVRLEVRYAGLGFVMSDRIRYRQRLEGFDAEWVERGGQRSAEFTNLPAGEYVLRISAAHPHGPWSGEEARVRIVVRPAPWERPLVWVGVALLVLGAAGGLVGWRLRAQARREGELRRLVEQRTADLQRQTDRLLVADAEKSRLLSQLHAQSEEFARQAREDALTGLTNRRAFDELLAQEFRRAARSGAPLCLALVDLDHFKTVNDRWSHAVGDEVLKRTAGVLAAHCRGIDSVSRWGGEEFALLLPHTGLEDARQACERLRVALAATDFDDLAPGLRITASIGLASHAGHTDHDRLVAAADAALYAAKDAGRDRVCVDAG